MIYNFYIFNRKGVCIFYHEFVRPVQAENLEEEQKLLFGFLKAIVTFVERVSPTEYVLICFGGKSFNLNNYLFKLPSCGPQLVLLLAGAICSIVILHLVTDFTTLKQLQAYA